jgi:hypothetical protein
MDYVQITSIDDPNFTAMHRLMGEVFPAEEVLEASAWAGPLQDASIRVFAAVHEGEVVGATEYRFYPNMRVAMTDFTIIGREGLGIGPFLARNRQQDLFRIVKERGSSVIGMFAEIYNPYLMENHSFGGIKPMNPFVRREVLAHLGYRKLDFTYVHPSWQQDGEGVHELDLCFLAYEENLTELPSGLVSEFLRTYYAILEHKPEAWFEMIDQLESRETVVLQPI